MVESASQILGLTVPTGVRIPRARRAVVDPNVRLVDALHIANTDERLGAFETLPDTEQATLLRLATSICGAVIEMGADPDEAAAVAVDTLCAAADIVPHGGIYGQ